MCICSHISFTAENGEGGAKTISNVKPSTSDRCTQTEPWIPNHKAASLALTQEVKKLSLEDALPEVITFTDDTLTKPHREEYDIDKDDSEKKHSWSSVVENTIQPSTIRTLQQQQSKGSEESQDSCSQIPKSSLPEPPKGTTISHYGAPLSPIQEGEKLLCVDPHTWIQSLGWLLKFTNSCLESNPNTNACSAAKTKVTTC